MTRSASFRNRMATTLLAAAVAAASPALLHGQAPAEPAGATAPSQAQPIMPLDEVRIGMKGYGLTVFQGTRIEPFPVEVVSVIHDFNPGRGAIWIRSDHPTLVVSGPVQGMSGSPIYLWEEGEEQQLGQGGRLVGAFAYGYEWVKECLAGVQPIELMRGVGDEILPAADGEAGPQARGNAHAGSTRQALAAIERLQHLATQEGASAIGRTRLDATAALIRQIAARRGIRLEASPASDRSTVPPGPDDRGGDAVPLLLPMSVGTPEIARLAAPMLQPLGIHPVANGRMAGRPPAGIDAERTSLEPGSVLAIPLAYGDLDLSATGTVTDVLPDGRVLGFGHSMFGQGPLALPMATGYVHFFVPRANTSFKQSGSLRIQGSIVQDQNPAVAGVPEIRHQMAPVTVNVRRPGIDQAETFSYEVANHPELTPVLAAILTLQSMTAVQDLPIEHTLRMNGEVVFSGGRTLALSSVVAGGGALEMVLDMLPALMLPMNNPHENLTLESASFSTEIEPVLRVGTLTSARLERAVVAPGETLRIAANVQPYGEAIEAYRLELKVPDGTPEGDYPLHIMDASSYAAIWLSTRPHLLSTTTVDDIMNLLRDVMRIRKDALYCVLQLPQEGLAIGRVEMPRLPSSRRAILAAPTSSAAVPYVDAALAHTPTDVVVEGQLTFTVSVRRPEGAEVQRSGAAPTTRTTTTSRSR